MNQTLVIFFIGVFIGIAWALIKNRYFGEDE